MKHPSIRPAGVAAAMLALLVAGPAIAAERFCKQDKYHLRPGETHVGDLYTTTTSITLAGHHQGDLIGFASSAVISGTVDGDVMLMGQSFEISGTVHDTVRVWGQSLTISGTVDGDVLFFGSHVSIHPNARIGGRLLGFGGTAILAGTIENGVSITVGQAQFDGTVIGNVVVKADAISFGDEARIEGDLRYTTRNELDAADLGSVTGESVFTKKEKKKKNGKSEPFLTTGKILMFGWKLLASMLVGFVLLILLRGALPALMRPIREEPMLGGLIGFGTFLVVPAACLLAFLPLISIPLGIIVLILFVVTLYLAKLPVALWLGQRLLQLVGLPSASPFLALALGLVVLYLIFNIPFWIGLLAKFATLWLGLGTILMAIRARYTPPAASAPTGGGAAG